MSGRRLVSHALLLRLLPREFRSRHGAAMTETFTALHARASQGGRWHVGRLWLREVWDVTRTGAVLRWRGADMAMSGRRPGRPRMIGSVADDLRLALRATTRSRAFFVLAALTLALGVGATTAMYSALRAIVLDPLPFPAGDRLVMLWRTFDGSGGGAMLALEAEQVEVLRAERDIFAGIEAISARTGTLTGLDEPVRVRTYKVTAGLPSMMGVQPVIGRTFTDEETVGEGRRVVLLSHAFWRSRFGGRRDVPGETLNMDGEVWTVIGVMPREAVRPDGNLLPIDLWLPLAERDHNRMALALLAPGVDLTAAAARVDGIVRRMGEGSGLGGTVDPVTKAGPLHDHLRVLMIAVTLLLLIACVNVSNLLLQRAATRGRETAVRAALGAGRLRLMRQFLFESGILALAGGLLGAAFAYGGLRLTLLTLTTDQVAALHGVRIDGTVLLFCVAVTAAAGMLFGVLPAWRGSHVNATAALGRANRGNAGGDAAAGWAPGVFGAGASGAGSARFRWTLVATEVALSFALLVGAALVVGSLREMSARDPGYRADGLVAIDVRLPAWRYTSEPVRAAAFESIVADVRSVAGVESVSLADGVAPRPGSGRFGHVHVEGQARDTEPSFFHSGSVDAAFLQTIGQPLVAGRGFTVDDARSELNPVVLTESAARRLFPDGDAVGRRFGIEGTTRYTVIGVARDIRTTGLTDEGGNPLAYWPLVSVGSRMTVVARAARYDPQFMLDLRQLVHRTEPDAITEIATVRELLGASIARERFTTTLLSTFAALALLLAAVGLYGVLSQVVVGRTHEFGVRMALGADAGRIHRLVLRSGLLATLGGLAIGAVVAAAGLRALRSEVFGLTEQQPAAYLMAAMVLLAVALAAMLLPASRAARLDPMRAISVD